jgi:hypothetical protein
MQARKVMSVLVARISPSPFLSSLGVCKLLFLQYSCSIPPSAVLVALVQKFLHFSDGFVAVACSPKPVLPGSIDLNQLGQFPQEHFGNIRARSGTS